jgi:hypothetical protein
MLPIKNSARRTFPRAWGEREQCRNNVRDCLGRLAETQGRESRLNPLFSPLLESARL